VIQERITESRNRVGKDVNRFHKTETRTLVGDDCSLKSSVFISKGERVKRKQIIFSPAYVVHVTEQITKSELEWRGKRCNQHIFTRRVERFTWLCMPTVRINNSRPNQNEIKIKEVKELK